MKGGMERERRRREPMGMVQLPRECGLCIRRSRGCGPAVADQLITGSIWSCRPQVAGSRTLGAGTNCGSATDITAYIRKVLEIERRKNANMLEITCYYVGRAVKSNLYSPWCRSRPLKGTIKIHKELMRLLDAER